MSYIKRFLSVAAICSAVLMSGCSQSARYQNGGVVQRAGNPDVVGVADEDVTMNAAMREARSTVQAFIVALKSPKPNQEAFSIKKQFADSNGAEHMWISDLQYDGKEFKGRLSNEPVDVNSVKLGDNVTVAPQDISDWMYLDKGKLVGGYTIRVLYDKMTPEEQKKFEQESGYTISSP
jgi:uncharacterized protein YegJ (DUF2314 family)